jgi:hypothetical protein
LGTRVKLGKEVRLRKDKRLGKIRNVMESEELLENFWKNKWGLGKDKMRLRKGKFWKVVGNGRRRSKWKLGKRGRLRIE